MKSTLILVLGGQVLLFLGGDEGLDELFGGLGVEGEGIFEGLQLEGLLEERIWREGALAP